MVLLILLVGTSGLVAAQEQTTWGYEYEEIETSGFAISWGLYDVDDPLEASELGVDYSFGTRRWGLVPHVGLHGSEDQTYYLFAGGRRHFRIGRRWLLTPSWAVSFHEPGDGKDLGFPVEFRTGLSFGRELADGAQFGLGFFHLSNASLSSDNPGANSLLLRYRFPRRDS